MTKLAAASGVVIYEDGPKLYISKTPAPWTSTFLFITALMALILLFNGVLQLFLVEEPNGSPMLGVILIVLGTFFSILSWRVWVYQKKMSAIPLEKLKNIAVVDFESNNLLDEKQNVLTPLHQAYLKRKMQLTSSSPELILEWDNGYLRLVKGNPFSGGVSVIEKVLLSKGLRKG